MQLKIKNLSKLKEFTSLLATNLKGNEFFLLSGDLGAGKTTFVKEIGKFLLIEEAISSPTFTIVQFYQGKWPVYHFDLYRINDERELIDLDLDLYLNKEAIIFIEWAEKLKRFRPQNFLEIDFNFIDEDARLLTLTPYGLEYENLLAPLKDLCTNGFC